MSGLQGFLEISSRSHDLGYLARVSKAKSSLVEQVFESLRRGLLSGEFEPGTRLRTMELANRCSAGQSVVREALTRLAGEGLILASPQRGFSVVPMTSAELQDLTRARVLLEGLLLRESVERGGLSWEGRVLATHHTLKNTPMDNAEGDFSPDWNKAHREFHAALLSGANAPRLQNFAVDLRERSTLYQFWSKGYVKGSPRDIPGEHSEIAQLALDHATDGAVRALGRHIETTTELLLPAIASRGQSGSS